MVSLHKNIQLMLEFLKGPFLVPHFSYYTLMTFLMMLSVIFLSMLMILLSTLSVIRHLICEHCGLGQEVVVNLNGGETQLVLFDQSNNTDALNVKMDRSNVKEKSYFMFGLTFSFKLDWGSYIISIVKIGSKKTGALTRSIKCLSPEVAMYLYKSVILSCMQYCFTSGLDPIAATRNC